MIGGPVDASWSVMTRMSGWKVIIIICTLIICTLVRILTLALALGKPDFEMTDVPHSNGVQRTNGQSEIQVKQEGPKCTCSSVHIRWSDPS